LNLTSIRDSKTTYADLAYRYLLEAIISCHFQPGENLKPRELATVLGISRSPIERAIERLAGEGLVDLRAGLGPCVHEPAVEEILQFHDLRLMLERQAVRLGFAQADGNFRASMAALLRHHEETVARQDGTQEQYAQLIEADRNIHLHIMSLWQNPRAQAWYLQINTHLRSMQLAGIATSHGRRALYDSISYWPKWINEHRAILAAFESNQVEAAVTAVEQHTREAKAIFRERALTVGLATGGRNAPESQHTGAPPKDTRAE
jgi:DNA-binding GntR family transcriptional regulator